MKPPQQSPDFPDAFYRVVTKGLCVREGKLLMVKDMTPMYAELGGRWEIPGGGLDFGEDVATAVGREVKEEMGLEVTYLAEKPTYIWTSKRQGKRGMEWHHVCILAYRFDVKDLNFTPSEECTEIRFVSREELQTLPVSDQLEPLRKLFDPKDFE